MKIVLLFVLILVQIEAFAKKPQLFYSVPEDNSQSKLMILLNNDNVLVKIEKSVGRRFDYAWDKYLFLFDNNGEDIDSMFVHIITAHYENNSNNEGSWVGTKSSEIVRYRDGRLSLFLLAFTNHLSQMQKIGIGDDLLLSYTNYDWESSDIYQTIEMLEHWTVCNDGDAILAYFVDSLIYSQAGQDYCGISVLKSDSEGQKVEDYLFCDVPYCDGFSAFYLFPSPDFEGCRLVICNLVPNPFTYSCLHLGYHF